VIWADGRYDKISLLDVFAQGSQITDLAVRPHERISLMRLLICITQAALDGPEDYDAWKSCLPKIAPAAIAYLDIWKDHFELFGDGPRFLQTLEITSGKKSEDKVNSPSKLDMALATGNNTTIFDNEGSVERVFDPPFLALGLLTYQCFSPGGLIGSVKWRNDERGSSSKNAPCITKGMLHSYIRRGDLLSTIHANILSREVIEIVGHKWGRPLWEAMPNAPNESDQIENATRTYLGRLVALSRLILLDRSGQGMLLGTGLEYETEWREVAGTTTTRHREGKEEVIPLGGSPDKAIWRMAHSLAVARKTSSNMAHGPVALAQADLERPVELWSGALIADKSKLIDTIESVLTLPPAMFADQGQAIYRDGVAFSEAWERKLSRGIAIYHRHLKDDLERKESRKRGNLVKQKASTHFWTSVEQCVPDLLAVTVAPQELYPAGATEPVWPTTRWGQALASHAREAYDLACPRETPRQIQAYVEGLKAFYESRPDPSSTQESSHE